MGASMEWWRAEMPPHIMETGDYEATVAATGQLNGISGCAWEIRRKQSSLPLFSDAKKSYSNESTAQRGYVAAALGTIATLRGPATLTIWSNSTYLRGGLKHDAVKWKQNGWIRPNGETAMHVELWDLILCISNERGIAVNAEYESKDSHIPYDRVMALATAAASK